MVAGLTEQIAEVTKEYTQIRLTGASQLSGQLPFKAKYLDYPLIIDEFEIELEISHNYPVVLPSVKERGDRLTSYSHVNKNMTFCLGAPLAVRKKFIENPTLLGFLREQVIPFLYAFRVWQDIGVSPFGELKHGGEGILDFYREHFNVNNDLAVLELLSINILNNSRPFHKCPCESSKRLNKCHWPQLQDMYCQTRNERLYEFKQALDGYHIRHKEKPQKFHRIIC
jgi:hypothetical protein